MAKKTGKSRVKRISGKLDDLLIGMSQKNEINFVDAGDIIVDIINKKSNKRRVIENIRREIEF